MRHYRLLPFVAFLVLLTAPAWATEPGKVVAVTDGDTIKVEIAGRVEKVRLIGVDTPETVHPQKPVEYFGKEASEFTRRMALGKLVRLEEDQQTTDRDHYGRLLRYVFLPDGKLLNAEIIAQGYGHAYTRFPFTRMEEFRTLEREAREANRGLWGDTGAPTSSIEEGNAATATGTSKPDPAETVYITRTGTKYHRQGCRHLAKSAIPIALKAAAARYGPCSVCAPPRLPTDAPTPQPIGPGEGTTPTPKTAPAAPQRDDQAQTVYVTRTGTKYHRAGCRYLVKSQVPLSLKEAAARYGPCSVCAPPTSAGASASSAPAGTPPVAAGRCQAITKKGTQCKRNAAPSSLYCWQHQR